MADDEKRDNADARQRQQLAHARVTAMLIWHLKPRDIARLVRQQVVGQDEAVETLSVGLHHHVVRFCSHHLSPTAPLSVPKETILLIGPSGCGKSLLASTLADMTELPFVSADMTQLTEAGWVGTNVDDLVASLYERSDRCLDLSQWGVMLIDEIDKCRARQGSGRDISGEGAQEALLRLLDHRGEIIVRSRVGAGPDSYGWCGSFDVSHLMVIAAGAFVGLEDIIRRRLQGKRRLGFAATRATRSGDELSDHGALRQVTPEDLIAYGMKPELIGRIGSVVVVCPLGRDALRCILTESPQGPIQTQRRLAAAQGFELEFTPALVEALLDQAESAGLGARSLFSGVRGACRRAWFEVPSLLEGRRGDGTVTLDEGALTDGSYQLRLEMEVRIIRPSRPAGKRRAAPHKSSG